MKHLTLDYPPKKAWSPRKVLIVSAANRADREKLKTFYGLASQPARNYIQDCIEACVNEWRQNDINGESVDYYKNASDRATGQLISAVIKHVQAGSSTRLTM